MKDYTLSMSTKHYSGTPQQLIEDFVTVFYSMKLQNMNFTKDNRLF